MREIKNNIEILQSSAEDYMIEFLNKVFINNISIEMSSIYGYLSDLLLVHLYGIIETKFRAYKLFIAEYDAKLKFELYDKPNSIQFDFHNLYKLYEEEFDKKISAYKKEIADTLKSKTTDKQKTPNVNNISDASIFTLTIKPSIKEAFEITYKVITNYNLNEYMLLEYKKIVTNDFFIKLNGIDTMEINKLECIYQYISKIFDLGYKYRNIVAHNLEFGYKTNKYDFDMLNDEPVYNSKIAYYFVLLLADRLLYDMYRNFVSRNMLDI